MTHSMQTHRHRRILNTEAQIPCIQQIRIFRNQQMRGKILIIPEQVAYEELCPFFCWAA